MASKPVLRVVTVVVIAAAMLAGIFTRLQFLPPGAGGARFAGVGAINLRPGEPIGGFVFDEIEGDAVAALRLRTVACDRPIFAAPMLLSAVTSTEVVDSAFLLPGYRAFDVYDGALRAHFSHFERLLARVLRATSRTGYGFFVRFYAPADCPVESEVYIAAAERILKLGSTAERTAGARAF